MIYEEPTSQQDVDRYLEETEKFVLEVDCEEKAVDVLKRINYLKYISDEYFVPDMIDDWKEMALKHMESPEAYFKKVLYGLFQENHPEFFESINHLKDSALSGHLSEEELFSMVRSFNNNLETTNESCERYGMEKFPKYRFKSDLLQKNYEKWLMSE